MAYRRKHVRIIRRKSKRWLIKWRHSSLSFRQSGRVSKNTSTSWAGSIATRRQTCVDRGTVPRRPCRRFLCHWRSKVSRSKRVRKGLNLRSLPVTFIKRETEWVAWKDATKTEQKRAKEGSLPTRKAMYYKIGHVFEYTQTDATGKGTRSLRALRFLSSEWIASWGGIVSRALTGLLLRHRT